MNNPIQHVSRRWWFPALAVMALAVSAATAAVMQVTPTTVDFGWSPENAHIYADFRIENTGDDVLSVASLHPSCGCTTVDFSPGDLSRGEEQRITIAFNTRGYRNRRFNMPTRIATGGTAPDATIRVTGFVSHADAVFAPVDDGIVRFLPDAKRRQTVSVQNRSDAEMAVRVIREADAWATVKVGSHVIPPGDAIDVDVRVRGPLDERRDTSLTLEATGATGSHRLTLAIQTGPARVPLSRRLQPPVPAQSPAPTPDGNP